MNKEMQRIRSKRKIGIALINIFIVVSIFFCIFAFSLLIRSTSNEIREAGLKHIVEEIWEGKKYEYTPDKP